MHNITQRTASTTLRPISGLPEGIEQHLNTQFPSAFNKEVNRPISIENKLTVLLEDTIFEARTPNFRFQLQRTVPIELCP